MLKKKTLKADEVGKDLNAKNLKSILWNTLQDLRSGVVEVGVADAIASQSREIVRVIKTQQAILSQAHQDVTGELKDFAK